MQYRNPVGWGPSVKTCPRCPSHNRQLTAVRTTIRLPSGDSTTFSAAIGSQKLGQPVPESNFAADEKRGKSHPAQVKIPRRCSSSNAPVNGRSVSACRITQYASRPRRPPPLVVTSTPVAGLSSRQSPCPSALNPHHRHDARSLRRQGTRCRNCRSPNPPKRQPARRCRPAKDECSSRPIAKPLCRGRLRVTRCHRP